jgi:hypothetical protein
LNAFNTIIKLFYTIVYIGIITLTLIFREALLVEYPLWKTYSLVFLFNSFLHVKISSIALPEERTIYLLSFNEIIQMNILSIRWPRMKFTNLGLIMRCVMSLNLGILISMTNHMFYISWWVDNSYLDKTMIKVQWLGTTHTNT